MTARTTESSDDHRDAPRSGSSASPGPSSRRRTIVVIGIVAVALTGLLLLVLGLLGGEPARTGPSSGDIAVARAPVTVATGAASAPAGDELPASPPRSIDIPAIGVRSVINPSGLEPDGTLAVPAPGPRYDQAAWYTGSATPGRPGPAVILGHIDSAANGPSVFYRLSQLRPLDEFSVTRDDGVTLVYKVNSVRQYPKDAFPTEQVYGPTTRPELRLITCGGAFDDTARSYRDNTVVYANQIRS